MAIRLPSEDSTQFFTGRPDAVHENLETQVKISLSANVVVCHSISLESELTDITESIERNINGMVFMTDGITLPSGVNSKWIMSIAPLRSEGPLNVPNKHLKKSTDRFFAPATISLEAEVIEQRFLTRFSTGKPQTEIYKPGADT